MQRIHIDPNNPSKACLELNERYEKSDKNNEIDCKISVTIQRSDNLDIDIKEAELILIDAVQELLKRFTQRTVL